MQYGILWKMWVQHSIIIVNRKLDPEPNESDQMCDVVCFYILWLYWVETSLVLWVVWHCLDFGSGGGLEFFFFSVCFFWYFFLVLSGFWGFKCPLEVWAKLLPVSCSELHWWCLSSFSRLPGDCGSASCPANWAAINLAQVSHNDSTGIRGVLTTLQEGLALHTDIFIPRAASPALTSLPTLGSLCLRITRLHSCSACFVQSFPSVISFRRFFPLQQKIRVLWLRTQTCTWPTHAAQLPLCHPEELTDVRARLAPDHCCIFLLESTDAAWLSRSLQFHLEWERAQGESCRELFTLRLCYCSTSTLWSTNTAPTSQGAELWAGSDCKRYCTLNEMLGAVITHRCIYDYCCQCWAIDSPVALELPGSCASVVKTSPCCEAELSICPCPYFDWGQQDAVVPVCKRTCWIWQRPGRNETSLSTSDEVTASNQWIQPSWLMNMDL